MDDDDRYASKLVVLNSWRRLLKDSREIAEAKAQAALRIVQESGIAPCRYNLARYYAQMMNGSAAPEDFLGGLICRHSVASAP